MTVMIFTPYFLGSNDGTIVYYIFYDGLYFSKTTTLKTRFKKHMDKWTLSFSVR